MSDVDAGRRRLDMSYHDVWVGYFAVGGNGSLADVRAWLSGDMRLPAHDHDLLVQAINDAFTDVGLDHPLGYSTA